MYDAIVVGARCAGSPLAMILGRRGHRVLLIDRTRFPSDTMSTHFIQAPGMARLSKWGLLQRLEETGVPKINHGVLQADDEEMTIPFTPTALVPWVASPRRTILDKLLVDAAVEAGAEVREGLYLEAISLGDSEVKIVARDSEGKHFEEAAKVLVGADGRNSRVAELIGAPFLEFHRGEGAGFYGYWKGDFPAGATHFRLKKDRALITFPTHDGAHVIIAIWPRDRFLEMRRDPEKNVPEAYWDVPAISEPFSSATLTEKLIGVADLPNFVRKSTGPNWALVGDASYHKDPTPADGINDAFRGADLLADALDDVFLGRADLEEAMGTYENQRQQATERSLPATLRVGSFDLTPHERLQAFLELATQNLEEVTRIETEETR